MQKMRKVVQVEELFGQTHSNSFEEESIHVRNLPIELHSILHFETARSTPRKSQAVQVRKVWKEFFQDGPFGQALFKAAPIMNKTTLLLNL